MDDLTLTAWEREVLAMPVVDGVLRGQSPAWWVGPTGVTKRCIVIRTVESGPKWAPGPAALVLIAHYEEAAMRQLRDLGPEHEQVLWSPCWLSLSELRTCLTDATGRAHLAWWVAGQIRTPYGGALDPSEGVRWHRSWRGHWELHGQRADEYRKWQEVCFLPWAGDDDLSDRNAGPHGTWCRFVPSLAALDPNDPRLLPDGSRLVDALALGLVARHVAGLAIPEVPYA